MCTNKIRALAVTAVDKVNWAVVQNIKTLDGCGFILIHSACYVDCMFICMINDRLHLNITRGTHLHLSYWILMIQHSPDKLK